MAKSSFEGIKNFFKNLWKNNEENIKSTVKKVEEISKQSIETISKKTEELGDKIVEASIDLKNSGKIEEMTKQVIKTGSEFVNNVKDTTEKTINTVKNSDVTKQVVKTSSEFANNIIEKAEKTIKDINKKINKEHSSDSIYNIRNIHMGVYRNYPNKKLIPEVIRKKRSLRSYLFSNPNFEAQQLEIENSKYSKKEEAEKQYFDRKELPNQYYTNEITLIPKNTNTLYTYWEVREDTFENLNKNYTLSSDNPTILLKNLNNNKLLDIKCHSRIGSMFINNVDCDSEYIVSLGFYNIEGNFIEIAHSNPAIVPNNKPSENNDITWGYADINRVNEVEVIDFRILSKEDAKEYIGFSQEILDKDPLSENIDRSKFLGSSENMKNYHLGSSDNNK